MKSGYLPSRRALPLLLLAVALVLSGCGRNMWDQPRYDTYEPSRLFEDGMSARPLVEGTVSRQRGALPLSYLTGQETGGTFLDELPFPVTVEVLQRGQERYNIYCAMCHNYNGDGGGLVVQKGFPQPVSLHDGRLRNAPVGYFFTVMTNGFGRMYPYASRIPPEDRWAIAGYIRALQVSQSASEADIPAETLALMRALARSEAGESVAEGASR